MTTITEKRKFAKEIFSSTQSIKAFFKSEEGFSGIEYDKFENLLGRVKTVNDEILKEKAEEEQKQAELRAEREEQAKKLVEMAKLLGAEITIDKAYETLDELLETKTAKSSKRKMSERKQFTYQVGDKKVSSKSITNEIKDELQKVKKGAENTDAYLLVVKEEQKDYLKFAIGQPRFAKTLQAMADHFKLDLETVKEEVQDEKKAAESGDDSQKKNN